MKTLPKMVLTVLGHTVYNDTLGKTDATMLIVCVLILGWPLINILRGLIDALRNG